MWTRVWMIAGMVNQLAKAGDYLTFDIGRESILCVRGTDERIRAFYNVCQHRGNRLVSTERGLAGRRRVPVRVPRLALRRRRHPEVGVLRGGLPPGQPLRQAQPRGDPLRHVGRLRLDQHGRGLRRAAGVPPPRRRPSRLLPHGAHEAHPLGDARGRLQLEVRAGQLQRELPPALRAPADAAGHERALHRLPVRPLPERAQPHADAGRRTAARATRASPTARSRASPRSSSSGSSTPSRTARTSRASAPRCSSASASSAPARATTSRATPTSS